MGTASCPLPPERFTVMVSPLANCVRPAGVCIATVPNAYVLSITSGPLAYTNPAPSMDARAASSEMPTTGGTSTVTAGKTSVMVSPSLAVSPPAGDWLCTNCVASHTVSTGLMETTNFALSRDAFATSHDWPDTLGIVSADEPPMLVMRKIMPPTITRPATTAPMM